MAGRAEADTIETRLRVEKLEERVAKLAGRKKIEKRRCRDRAWGSKVGKVRGIDNGLSM